MVPNRNFSPHEGVAVGALPRTPTCRSRAPGWWISQRIAADMRSYGRVVWGMGDQTGEMSLPGSVVSRVIPEPSTAAT